MSLLSGHQTQTSKDTLPVNGQPTLLGPICKFKYTSKQYESLASHFNIYVTISVFTVVALVALLAVLRDTIGLPKGSRSADRIHFMLGELLSMVVMALHFGVIVIGGRSWSLCVRLVADRSEARPVDLDFDSTWDNIAAYRQVPFDQYVTYCEQVQFVATILFLASVLIMGCSIFPEKAFPLVFLGFVTFLVFSVYSAGCWQVSRVSADSVDLVWGMWETQWDRWTTA